MDYIATKLASTLTKVAANVRSVIAASTCTRYPTGPKRTSVLPRANCADVDSVKTRKRYTPN